MVVGYAAREAIRFGARYFPRTFATIKRADVGIHKSLYGAYHGFKGGDDLDGQDVPGISTPSRKFSKTRNRYFRGRRSRCYQHNRFSSNRR